AFLKLALLFFFQAEDGIRDLIVTGVQTCALPISVPARLHAASTASNSGIVPSTITPRSIGLPARGWIRTVGYSPARSPNSLFAWSSATPATSPHATCLARNGAARTSPAGPTSIARTVRPYAATATIDKARPTAIGNNSPCTAAAAASARENSAAARYSH